MKYRGTDTVFNIDHSSGKYNRHLLADEDLQIMLLPYDNEGCTAIGYQSARNLSENLTNLMDLSNLGGT